MINLTHTALHTLLAEEDEKRVDAELADLRAGRDLAKRPDPRTVAVASMMPMLGSRRG